MKPMLKGTLHRTGLRSRQQLQWNPPQYLLLQKRNRVLKSTKTAKGGRNLLLLEITWYLVMSQSFALSGLLTLKIEDPFIWRSKWSHLSRYPGVGVCNGVRSGMLGKFDECVRFRLLTASQALPLMNIVFGSLVGDFNQYFIPGAAPSKKTFKASINKSRRVASHPFGTPGDCKIDLLDYSLYIVYLFIGKFALTYVSMVSQKFLENC